MPVASVPSTKSYIHQARTPWGGQERESARARVRMLDGRERTFCSSCLILLLWFCSSAAAHRASGQHAVHNGVDADRRLPSTLFSRPSILASPIRESVFKLCVSRMFMALRGGTAAPLQASRTQARAPQQPFSVMAVRSAARGGKPSGRSKAPAQAIVRTWGYPRKEG